jgi:hypothetical protein
MLTRPFEGVDIQKLVNSQILTTRKPPALARIVSGREAPLLQCQRGEGVGDSRSDKRKINQNSEEQKRISKANTVQMVYRSVIGGEISTTS